MLDNFAPDGGSFYVDASWLLLSGSVRIAGGQAFGSGQGRGGALVVVDVSVVSIDGQVIMENCSAQNGGAVYVDSSSSVT